MADTVDAVDATDVVHDIYPAELVQACATRVLVGMGAPDDLADLVAKSLVLSNLVGHDSHGVIRLLEYAGWVRPGHLDPRARPIVDWEASATSLIDGRWGWGQASAQLGTQQAARLAHRFGAACVVLRRTHHVGRLGEYVDSMASEGLVGIAFCNTGGAVVAPFGGRTAVLGTNPFAWAAPQRGQENLVLDFSTAVIAAGKVVLAALNGEEIPPNAMLDKDGNPTVNADDLEDGGALLAFGAHKGSGLSILIEVVAGLLAGTLPSCLSHTGYGNGTVLIALDVSRFVDPDAFDSVARTFADAVHSSTPVNGSPVLLPGELESITSAQRRRDGVTLPLSVRRSISALGAEFHVSLPELE